MFKLRLRFKGKVLLPIIIVVVIVTGLVQYVSYRVSSSIVLENAKNEIAVNVKKVKDLVDQQIKSNEQFVTQLSYNPEVINAFISKSAESMKNSSDFLALTMKRSEQIEGYALIDKSGKVFLANDDKLIGLDLSGREYFKEALAGKSYVSKVIRSKATNNAVFSQSTPVRKEEDIVGVLVVVDKMKYIDDNIVADAKIGENGRAFIFDNAGVLLSYPKDPSKVLDKEFSKNNTVGKEIATRAPTVERYWWAPSSSYRYMGVDKTDNGWNVGMSVSEANFLVKMEKVLILSLGGTLFLVVIICVVVLFVVGPVAKIMAAVNGSIGNLSRGNNSDIEVFNKILNRAVKRQDELSEIAESLFGMKHYLADMAGTASKIAAKDLSAGTECRGEDDMLGNAFQNMLREFNKAFSQVHNTVEQVNKGAAQLSSASQSLSSGAAGQAASIEEIGAAVSELGTQTKYNADNATEANEISIAANNSAMDGRKQMEQLSSAMERISGRAKETQNVIKTIDDIAFQTNLLALNAAVEAARAGQHGKGFAVVAEEVRNLAARSAKAAGETAELIENMVNEIFEGNKMAGVTAESLNGIAEGIEKSATIISEIAKASNEQAASVSQIDISLKQIESITQSNTANAEETANSSEEMMTISAELTQLVSEFKLSEQEQKRPVKNAKRRIGRKKQNVVRSMANAAIVHPEDSIVLDDSEFGKF